MKKSFLIQNRQDGNILLMVLLAIALIAALSVAIQGTSQDSNHIDDETLLLRASELQGYTSELERGIAFIMQNSKSEADIRFSHPNAHGDYGDLSSDTDTSDQMFDRLGGGAKYRDPPEGINDGSAWEFYGNTAMPEVGSDEAELVAVLPNINEDFCEKINEVMGIGNTIPLDTGTCIYGDTNDRFDDTTQFSASPNTMNESSFPVKPSTRACIICDTEDYHYVHVLIVR